MLVFKKISNIFFTGLFVLISASIYSGCDNVDVIEPVNIYKENVVVRAELVADQIFKGVLFTKTLPVGATYSITTAGLRDIEAYIKVNGSQVIPLHDVGNGLFKPLYDYKIVPGAYYELFANHYGDPIYAKTYVPKVPIINSISYRSESYFFQGIVLGKRNEAYGASWVYASGSSGEITSDDFYSIEALPDVLDIGDVTVRTQPVPEQYRAGGNFSNLSMKVYSFDKAFQKYFQTKGNGKAIEDSFIHGGDNVGWNVEGKNAIGLFIGYSISASKQP
ncbi:MAG TPA: hypothetical protein VJ954_00490 [Ignavibacteriaceae bacterium]|nr:hypothetical protein [Ignavibacteriaceae bacterium]